MHFTLFSKYLENRSKIVRYNLQFYYLLTGKKMPFHIFLKTIRKISVPVPSNGPLFRVNFSKQKSRVIGSPEGFWPKGGGKARN